jgi:hypothetical protein
MPAEAPTLAQAQAALIGAVRGASLDAAWLAPARIAASQQLALYRNNHHDSLAAALAAVYPTVQALVGTDFFGALAARHITAHPPRSGNLHDHGETLPGLIEHFAPAAALPYLADVARLDWAWHCVFHAEAAAAPDAATLLAALAGADAAERAAACFECPATARLLASPHPVFDLWCWHQQAEQERGPLVLDGGPQSVLVHRQAGTVHVLLLAAAEHALLAALANGQPLGAALGAALAIDPALALADLLARHAALGTDRKSTRLNSSHNPASRMPSSA